MKWNKYPETKPSNDKQVEVLFYANAYEWFTGVYTPPNFLGKYEECFQFHDHQGDDKYHTVESVKYWLEIPKPSRAHTL